MMRYKDNQTPDAAHDEVFLQLKEMLIEQMGADTAEIIGIRRDSTFFGHLGLDSIQIVSFAEAVRTRYGDQIDFIGWFSGLPLYKLPKLSVGDVADFIERSIR